MGISFNAADARKFLNMKPPDATACSEFPAFTRAPLEDHTRMFPPRRVGLENYVSLGSCDGGVGWWGDGGWGGG